MKYNVGMATKWKVSVQYVTRNKQRVRAASVDAEYSELETLSRAATAIARESIKLVDARIAQACRAQLMREHKSAK